MTWCNTRRQIAETMESAWLKKCAVDISAMMFNLQLGTFVLILAQVNAEKAQNPEDGDRKARFIPHRASGIQIAKHQYCMQCIRGFVLHRDLLY